MTLIIALGLDLKDIPRRMRSKLNKKLKPIMIGLGQLWHRKLRKQHFGRGAHSRYRYKPRDPDYLKMKQRRGNRPDLVFSGKMNRYTAFGEQITGTARQSTVKMDIPNRKSSKDIQRQMVDELTAVDSRDRQTLTEELIDKTTKEYQKILEGK